MSAFFDDEPFDQGDLVPTAPADPRRVASGSTPSPEQAGAAGTAAIDGAPAAPLAGDTADTADSEPDADDEFIPRPPFRLAPLSVGLLALVVIGAGFIGGVLVQKHHDQGSTSSARGGAARAGGAAAGGFPGGTGAEGLGAAGFGGAGGTAVGGTGTAAGTGTGSQTGSAATPAVIGTVSSLSGQTLVVKNLGGKSVTVHLSSTTKVTTSYGAALKAGQTVSVTGSSATDGSVTATAVTVSS